MILGDESPVLREILSRSGWEPVAAVSTSPETQPNPVPELSLKEVSRRAALAAERELIVRVLGADSLEPHEGIEDPQSDLQDTVDQNERSGPL